MGHTPDLPDLTQAIVQAEKDFGALSKWIEELTRPVVAARVRDPATQDDLIQDVTVAIANQLPRLRDLANPAHYIRTMAINKYKDHLQYQNTGSRRLVRADSEAVMSARLSGTPSDPTDCPQTNSCSEVFIDSLGSPELKIIASLKFSGANRSDEAIAREVGFSRDKIRTRIDWILKQGRKWFERGECNRACTLWQ